MVAIITAIWGTGQRVRGLSRGPELPEGLGEEEWGCPGAPSVTLPGLRAAWPLEAEAALEVSLVGSGVDRPTAFLSPETTAFLGPRPSVK